MSLDTYRRSVSRLRDNILDLQKTKARKSQNASHAYARMNSAQQAANKSKNVSIIQSKTNEAERYSNKYSSAQDNVSKIETKISTKQKGLAHAIEKLEKEEKRYRDMSYNRKVRHSSSSSIKRPAKRRA